MLNHHTMDPQSKLWNAHQAHTKSKLLQMNRNFVIKVLPIIFFFQLEKLLRLLFFLSFFLFVRCSNYFKPLSNRVIINDETCVQFIILISNEYSTQNNKFVESTKMIDFIKMSNVIRLTKCLIQSSVNPNISNIPFRIQCSILISHG